jgi:hypothetical protein
MRTTVTLDDDVFELAKRLARLRGQSLGRTLSDLARRGLHAPTLSRDSNGLVLFQLPADSPRVTTEEVRRLESDGT